LSQNTKSRPEGGILFFKKPFMNVRDIEELLEAWAPRELAMNGDNIGLQCGDPRAAVRSILVALDPAEKIVAEAARRSVDLVVTHHPLLFRPARKVDLDSSTGRILKVLLSRGISLIAAHTNLDFAPGGTSHALAALLGLQQVEFLHTPFRFQKRIVTFVPPAHAASVADAMAEAGAGIIGNYERCSFRSPGTGTFRGTADSLPVVGRKEVFEEVPEVRLEMVAPAWRVDAVLDALRRAHPYEEAAFDVYATETPDRGHGMGVIGMLPQPLTLQAFLRRVKRVLGVPALRCSTLDARTVRRIAVCGGSGSDLTPEAVRHGAEVFVTADIRYHAFQDTARSIVLVDAGHYETERPAVAAIAARLRSDLRTRQAHIAVRAASTSTNPVRYV
jgi:dinuclear metal center YbgI/SA1388 family protein